MAEAEKEYIERGELIAETLRKIKENHEYRMAVVDYEFVDLVKDAPAADVVEVVHGEWIDRDGKTWCSRCDASNKQYKPPYCPHCGAKMRINNEQKK